MEGEIFACADCGMEITSVKEGCSFNYARKRNGTKVCNSCALREEIRHVENDDKIFAYLSSDGRRITDWKGNTLAKVTAKWEVPNNWARKLTCVIATTNNGRELCGGGPGSGMYVRLLPTKIKTEKEGE